MVIEEMQRAMGFGAYLFAPFSVAADEETTPEQLATIATLQAALQSSQSDNDKQYKQQRTRGDMSKTLNVARWYTRLCKEKYGVDANSEFVKRQTVRQYSFEWQTDNLKALLKRHAAGPTPITWQPWAVALLSDHI
jgi:hypothetical protein